MKRKLEPYPGTTATHRTARGSLRYDLTDEQVEWVLRNYSTHSNTEMSLASGISDRKIVNICKQAGVTKDPKFEKWLAKEIARKARATCKRLGIYERKKGKKPSEKSIEGLKRYWREGGIHSYKKLSKKAYKSMCAKKSAIRKKLIKDELLRIRYGLQRKSRLQNVVENPYTRSQVERRRNAINRGYLLDWDCKEGSPGRYAIYYEDQTERSAIFERNCQRDGFRVLPND